jgi:hypothetical protein
MKPRRVILLVLASIIAIVGFGKWAIVVVNVDARW